MITFCGVITGNILCKLYRVGTKSNYHLSTSISIISVLSYKVLEDDTKNEEQSSNLVEAETKGW